MLDAIQGNAVEAALEAIEQLRKQRQEQRKVLERAIEQTRYEARLAERRYEAVDPDKRLVASELEARWNVTLQKMRELEDKLQTFDRGNQFAPMPSKEMTLDQAAERLGVSPASVRRMIEQRKLLAMQVVVGAPWEIPITALDSEVIRQTVNRIKQRVRVPQTQDSVGQHLVFSEH